MNQRAARLKRITSSFIRDPIHTGRRAVVRLRARRAYSQQKVAVNSAGAAQQAFAALVSADRFRVPDRTVVILAMPTVREPVARWVAQFRGASVFVVAPETLPEWHLEALGAHHHSDRDMAKLNWDLKVIGAVDIVVDLMPRPIAEQKATFFQLFWHVKPGGMYVIDPSATRTDPFTRSNSAWMTTLIAANDAESPSDSARNREVSRSVMRVDVSRDLIAIEKRNKHYLKLRHAETNRVLPTREPNVKLDVLARLPSGAWQSHARVTSHESSAPTLGLNERIEYPELSLRHYRGKIAMVANQLLYTGYTILPDSFHHHLSPDLANRNIKNVSAQFARIPDSARPRTVLPGNYYHMDSQNSGHFGHLLTESVGRLWGWHVAKERMPDLKLLFRKRFPNEREIDLERNIFAAFGIHEQDIMCVDEPVFVESVVAAAPMWHNAMPFYVHPQIKSSIWDVITDHLVNSRAPKFDRIFVSRQSNGTSRACRNGQDVEALFTAHGFEVVYPELLSLSDQAALFANARVVAGFGGSAMYNLLFARNLETMIVLNHEAYSARGEHLFASFFDCDAHYFWSPPDPPEPSGNCFKGGFYSSWEFDFARNGAALEKLLTSL
ncbi:MAG TPA: glycosyltransferase 61 family protein [Mycobacterium sp.]